MSHFHLRLTRPLMWGCPRHTFVFRGFVIVVDDVLHFFEQAIVDFPFVCNLNDGQMCI